MYIAYLIDHTSYIVYIYMVTRSAAPPLPPPPWSMVQDAPPPVGWGVGPSSPWGGCGGFVVLGLTDAFE